MLVAYEIDALAALMPGPPCGPGIGRGHMKHHVLGISASVALAVLSIMPASAEPFANDAIERYRLGDPAMFAFLAGNVNGLIWANTSLRSNDHAGLFCVPPSVPISVQQAVEVMSKRIKENPAEGQLPVGSLLLQSLKETFPCK
jgi:hypothetical protein